MFRFFDKMLEGPVDKEKTFDLLASVLSKQELAKLEMMRNGIHGFEAQAMEVIADSPEPANDNEKRED